MHRAAATVLCGVAIALTGCGGSSGPPRFDAGDFHGARIDNPWFPLRPGTTLVYRGTKDGKRARDVVTVAAETKEILGVPCAVARDRLFLAGEPAEETLDWYRRTTGVIDHKVLRAWSWAREGADRERSARKRLI